MSAPVSFSVLYFFLAAFALLQRWHSLHRSSNGNNVLHFKELAQSHQLHKYMSSFGDRSFSVAAPRTLNKLPPPLS